MSKRVLAVLLALICALSLTGCICRHEWSAATCVSPSTCTKCDKTEGEALGHIWTEANCTEAESCSRCGAVEGAPLGHQWTAADCTNAAVCTRCSATEGEALGHDWLDATTEAPKTCSRCALTEGEPIVTDPRFKTAPAAQLIGKWKFDTAVPGEMLGIAGFNQPVRLRATVNFAPDGTYSTGVEIMDEAALTDVILDLSVEMVYLQSEAGGVSRETFDALIMESYGMSTRDYVKHTMGNFTLSSLFDFVSSTMNLGGVYYVEDGSLYTGLTWESPMTPSDYTVDAESLWVASFDAELGTGTVFTPMTVE